MSALRESTLPVQRNFNSDIYYYFYFFWPYPSRGNPTWTGLACKSLNFWHFFKLRDIVLLPACVRQREREMARGCCVSHAGCLFVVRPFPLLETHTHIHFPASAPCCFRHYQHVIPRLGARSVAPKYTKYSPLCLSLPLPYKPQYLRHFEVDFPLSKLD